MPLTARDRLLIGPGSRRPHKVGAVGSILAILGVVLLLFLALPYATLWRIDQAVRSGDMATLADLVDIESIRAEIKKKLNKDADSTIGELSDSFIRWLQEGIGLVGNQAVEQLVTLPWVRERLLAPDGYTGEGFLKRVTYAFFDAPDGFVVRIGSVSQAPPVQLRLVLHGLNWRISAVYY